MAHTRVHKRKRRQNRRKPTRKRRKRVKKVSRRYRRKSRATRRRMKGGAVKYAQTNVNFQKAGVKEVVPYKVGAGVPGGKGSLPINGRNYYALANPDMHDQNNWIQNTSNGIVSPVQAGGSGLTSLMPQVLLNAYRGSVAGADHVYDQWVGQETSLSSYPSVMKQGLKPSKLNNTPVNVAKIAKKAGKLAAKV